MVIEEVRKNKSAKRPNFHKGSLSHSPSQMNGDAKVQINSEIAIPKLQKLAETYLGVSDPHRFLTDLRVALGIPDSQGASKYGVVSIPKEDGSILQASLRVTNHQANANTYIDHDANYKYNLSIVVRRKQRKNTFIPNENVILDEYVYYGTKMQGIENPLTQIVNGIIVFLQSGEYKDTTGVAFKNQSVETKDRVPQNISVDKDGNWVSTNGWDADYVSENKQYNTNRNMKQTIKLSESELKRLVAESVKGAINELDWKTYASAAKKRAEQGASDYDIYQLDQAANKALSDKYKITGDGHFPYSPQIDTRKGESVYDTDEEGHYVKKYPHAGQTGRFPQLGYQGDFNDTYYTPIGDNVEDEPYERITYGNFPAHKERHKDMSDYFSGKSKYEKGKGWNNEAINRKIGRIVSECLKRNLR